MLPTAIYIVIFARDQWWIDLNGRSKGPYLTSEAARVDAVGLATKLAQDGRRSEVQLVEPGKKRRIVYQSDKPSGLSRAAALANH